MVLRVIVSDDPPDRAALSRAERPARASAEAATVAALADRVRGTITVIASDGHERTLPRRVRLAACFHVVRHLIERLDPALVHWHLGDTLFTADEFEAPPAAPAGARPAAAQTAPQPPRDAAEGEIDDTHARIDRQAASRMRSGDDATRAGEARLREARKVIFADDLIESTDHQRPPPRDVGVPEQVSVYLMTMTMMLLAFPVGFAMLVYTVLRGENLTVTARAMALTGVGIGLTGSDVAQVLSAIV